MKISITLPNYNHGDLISKNIESVLAQTYGDWELVIVDDGSTDDSWSVIEKYGRGEPRILAERFDRNRGALAAIGRCMERCCGELLYGTAADDYIDNPRFFELVVAALSKHSEAAGAFGRSRVVDSEDERELWTMGTSAGSGGYVKPERAVKEFSDGQLFIPGAAAVWRRRRMDEIGGYDPELGPQSDYFLNHALPMLYGAVFIDEVVSVTRKSKSSFSGARNDNEFFRYHALTENRFVSLPLQRKLSDDWRRKWRSNVVNGRLAITRQRQFIDLIRGFYEQIQPWEADSLPPPFHDCRREVEACCDGLESALGARIESAERIFEVVAGPLTAASAGSVAGGQKRPSLIRRVRARLGLGGG